MDSVFRAIRNTEPFTEAARRLQSGTNVDLGGLWGSSGALLCAALAEETARTILVVVAGVDDADDMVEDIEAFRPGIARLFPAWESIGSPDETPDAQIVAQRLTVFSELSSAKPGTVRIIVTPIQGLLQASANPETLRANRLSLKVGLERGPDGIAEWLVERGFEASPWIDGPGQFSRRGGILDILPYDRTDACRVEFFGDTIESMRLFDVETQRSSDDIDGYEFAALSGISLRAGEQAENSVCLLEYFPDDAIFAIVEPVNVQERAKSYLDTLGDPTGNFSYEAVIRQSQRLTRLCLETFPAGEAVRFNITMPEAFPPGLENVVQGLNALAGDVKRVLVFCNNDAEAQRLRETVPEVAADLLEKIDVRIGRINHGFKLHDIETAIVGHHEIFHRYSVKRPQKRLARARALEAFVDLQVDDLVVHVNHGIGRYVGTEVLDRDGTKQEFLRLQFRDKVQIYVPSTRINLVQKYVGKFEGRPRLSKIGGTAWEKRKAKVSLALAELAAEFVRMQAIRNTRPGIEHPVDDRTQKEFEAEFIYEETEDQITVLAEIKRDMESPRPMDRLICGDVGYGKTELAMRAAFKCAMNGKQVGVLVPTTVLAEQHFTTFTERMADYPLEIEVLSRFRTKAEQREILKRVVDGRVDILIGTHRIVSPDVEFADLGLVIIDEEQRFGVRHKEHFKRLRATVDVLTLTATPIPRTLHMSLLGIRDISALETPPQDRQAIETRVVRYDTNRIRAAILRELNRDGQVFFVHNRVHNIQSVAEMVADVVPEARIAIGHGQMPERELARHMDAFVHRRIDVLVCTTIIESGLDIPNANTIFINNADNFGLSDLHQLRGRVGRYKHRAYAYFMIDPSRRVNPKAAKRLKAIEEYAELGAGFRIALRDLEIRGAGNILGPEQSGHIAAVGYDLYCQLLENAVKRLRREPIEERPETTIHIGLAAFLADDYIPSEKDRLEIYRHFERARTPADLEAIRRELHDRFGKPPEPAEALFTLHEVRFCLERHGIVAVTLIGDRLVCTFTDLARFTRGTASIQQMVRVIDDETAHFVLDWKERDSARIVEFIQRVLGPKRVLSTKTGN